MFFIFAKYLTFNRSIIVINIKYKILNTFLYFILYFKTIIEILY